MEYPHEILPNPRYKLIDGNLSEYYLLRHTIIADRSVIYNSDNNTINVQHICQPSERINDLSSSLLGVFTADHSKIEFTADGKATYMHYCAPDEQVNAPVFEQHYNVNVGRHFWCIQIQHLQRVVFAIQRKEQKHEATCLVTHTPMLWNYWHFSLRWLLDNKHLEEFDEKERSKIARLIGHAALVTIATQATLDLPETMDIPKEFYLKN